MLDSIRFLHGKNLIEDFHAYFSTHIFTQIAVLGIKCVKLKKKRNQIKQAFSHVDFEAHRYNVLLMICI